MRLVTAAEIQELEKVCFTKSISSRIVMENAGRAVVTIIAERFSNQVSNGVLIFCGSGNNGGDGFVVARLLFELGIRVKVILIGESTKFGKDTIENYQLLLNLRIPVVKEIELEEASSFGLIVDAIMGTGAKGAARGEVLSAIIKVNNLVEIFKHPVISIDLPSGVDSDNGAIGSQAVCASLTVSFQLPKWGNLLLPGGLSNGSLIVADIGLGPSDYGSTLLDRYSFFDFEVELSHNSHKGTKGHVLVIGGEQGKSGSIKLAGMGALKSVSGLVTLVVPSDNFPLFSNSLLEMMSASLPGDGKGGFSVAIDNEIQELLNGKDAVIIGPGMGINCGSLLKNLLKELKRIKLPAVLDADALTILSEMEIELGENFVLTPHPGEMAKLLQKEVTAIQNNRKDSARRLSAKYGCWTVLKGAETIISSPSGDLFLCPISCPVLATAGSGDVLAGLIGALLGKGETMKIASTLGVYAHAYSGLILEYSQSGCFGSLAGDIVDVIPELLNFLPTEKRASLFSEPGKDFEYFMEQIENSISDL